jgi:hypothetical protein
MHSPHAIGLASHPFAVTPQYVPSPDIEVSPPSQESYCVGDNHLLATVGKQNSASPQPFRPAVLVS